MNKLSSIAYALVIGLGLASMAPTPALAEHNDCFIGCGVLSQGCVAKLQGGHSECKQQCKAMAHGRGRGHCMRDCAHVPKPAKQACKIARESCRAECDGHNPCGAACGTAARECFTMARSDSRDCRTECRTTAETQAALCAAAADPEACLEDVAEARGACLDVCGLEKGDAVSACADVFADCKAQCPPPDSSEPPDGAESDEDDE